MLLVPPCVAAVAKFADPKNTSARFAIENVQVREKHDGTGTIDATDTKIACRVYVSAPDRLDYPKYATLDVPPDPVDTLVPAKQFADAVAAAGKHVKKIAKSKSVLGNVAIVPGPDGARVCATDMNTEVASEPMPNFGGMMPPMAEVFAKAGEGACLTLSFDAELLARALSALAEMAKDGARVDIEVRKPHVRRGANGKEEHYPRPLVLRVADPKPGVEAAIAIVQPMAPRK